MPDAARAGIVPFGKRGLVALGQSRLKFRHASNLAARRILYN